MSRDALVVGINQYPYISHLKTPAFDAEAIAHILEQYGNFRVKRLPFTGQINALQVDPKQLVTVEELKTAIAQLFNPQGDNIPDIALLYFAGHGLRETLGGISEGYLATSDASPRKNIWGVSLQWLRRLLQESPVRQQIVWLDCCHSGELLNFDEADPSNREGRDRCFIAASRDFEVAYGGGEHGVLTNALLQALDPKRHPEGRVTTKTLVASLKQALEAVPVPQRFRHDYSGNEIILTLDRKEKSTHPAFAGCPYKGLDYFKTEDHEYFYGRTALTDKLLEKVRSKNFLVVLGASGSGKSSLVRAGLLYQLQQGLKLSGSDHWQIYQPFTPGENPLQRLAEVMGKELQILDGKFLLEQVIKDSPSDRIVLVVDQFEEVFTLCQNNSKRQQFFDCLLDTLEQTGNKFCLVLVMRTDFLDKCLPYSRLATLLGDESTHAIITPMTAKQLEEAIRVPASKVGLEIENALIKQILEDLGASDASGVIEGEIEESAQKHEPESLPLLEYTLEQLWLQPRMLDLLTLTSYQELGGVRGALRKQADAIFHELTPEEQLATRRIFVSLTRLGEGTEDTRRRVAQTDLVTAQLPVALIDQVVQKFAQKRLLVITSGSATGETVAETVSPLVEVAHEALIRHWPRLLGWLDENRDMLRRQRRIDAEAKQWAENGKKPEYLLQGSRLGDAEEFLAAYPEELSNLAVEVVRESQRERDRLQAEKLRAQADKVRLQRRAISWLSGGLTAALIATGVATWQWQRAEQQRQRTFIRELSTQAQLLQSEEDSLLERSVLLAIESKRRGLKIGLLPLEADQALRQGMTLLLRPLTLSEEENKIIWELNKEQKIIPAKFQNLNSTLTSFSPDRKYIAELTDRGVRLWEIATGQQVLNIPKIHDLQIISFSTDSKYFTAVISDAIKIWELPTGKEVIQLTESNLVPFWLLVSIELSKNSQYLALGTKAGIVQVIEVFNRKEIVAISHSKTWVKFLAFNPNGKYLAVGGGNTDKFTRLIEIPSGKEVARVSRDVAGGLIFSPDSQYLAGYKVNPINEKQEILKIWEMPRNSEVGLLQPNQELYSLAISPDGKFLAVTFEEGSTQVRRADNEQEIVRIKHEPFVQTIFSPNGKYLATVPNEKDGNQTNVRIWNLSRGEQVARIPTDGSIVFSPDSKYLTILEVNKVKFWDIINDREITEIDLSTQLDGTVEKIKISSDGRYLAMIWTPTTEQRDYTLLVQELSSGKELKRIKLKEDVARLIKGFVFSSDGKYVAGFGGDSSVSVPETWDGIIQVWQVSSGEKVKHIKLERLVSDVAFSPDSKFLAARVVDGTTRVWDLTSNQEEVTRIRHKNLNAFKSNIAFSPDGKYLITMDQRYVPVDENSLKARGKEVQIWFWQPEDQIAEACRRLTRNLTLQEWQQYLPNEPYHKTCPNLP